MSDILIYMILSSIFFNFQINLIFRMMQFLVSKCLICDRLFLYLIVSCDWGCGNVNLNPRIHLTFDLFKQKHWFQ